MDVEWAQRPDLLLAILAGWVTGAAVGLACTAILMIGLAREPNWTERFPGLKVSLPIFGVIAANAMLIGWTLIGVLLGFVYALLPAPGFSILVIAVGAAAGTGYWILRSGAGGAEAGIVWASLAFATVMFAGMVPLLVEVVAG